VKDEAPTIEVWSEGEPEIPLADLETLADQIADVLEGVQVTVRPREPERPSEPDIPAGMTLEELVEIADEAGTVDRATYFRLFPERSRYYPAEPVLPNERFMLLHPRPRSARRRALIAEVVHVVLIWAGGYGATKAADAAIAWARDRWRRDRAQNSKPLKRHVIIHGPNGEILRRIAVDEPEGVPEEPNSD
jgi:hypothetical protein